VCNFLIKLLYLCLILTDIDEFHNISIKISCSFGPLAAQNISKTKLVKENHKNLMPYTPKFIRVYIQLLKTHPAKTKILSGAVIVGSGDIVAQKFIEKKPSTDTHDYKRTLRIFLVGLLLIAPFNYAWLDHILPKLNKLNLSTNKRAISKLLLDQSIAAPIACTLYIAGNSVTKKQDPIVNVQNKLPETVQFFWRLWAPVQFLNFRFVPQMYNMPVVQVTNFIWMSFLSYLDNREQKSE